jgi:hypothetical protein
VKPARVSVKRAGARIQVCLIREGREKVVYRSVFTRCFHLSQLLVPGKIEGCENTFSFLFYIMYPGTPRKRKSSEPTMYKSKVFKYRRVVSRFTYYVLRYYI